MAVSLHDIWGHLLLFVMRYKNVCDSFDDKVTATAHSTEVCCLHSWQKEMLNFD